MRSLGVRPGVVQHTQRAGDKAAQVGALRVRDLGSFQTFSKLSSLGAFTDSTQPADTYNASDDPREMYFVTSRNFNFGGGQCVNDCNGLIVWGLYGTIGSQTMSGVTVATAHNYSLPPSANQPGNPNSIDTGDTRISGGVVYASINASNGSGNSACVLYRIAAGAIATLLIALSDARI